MLFDALNDIVNALGEKANGAVEATKLSVALSQQRKNLTNAEQKIGEYYLTKYLEENAADEGILDVLETGRVAREAIADLTEKLTALEEMLNARIVPGKKVCEACGAYCENDAKFCSQCGAEFPEEVEAEDIDDDDFDEEDDFEDEDEFDDDDLEEEAESEEEPVIDIEITVEK